MADWTYFVQSEDGGPIKIGYTGQNPLQRLAALMTGSPVKLRLVGLIAKNIESDLHRKFSAFRVHGEWFTPAKELLSYIRENASKTLQAFEATSQDIRLHGKAVPVLSVNQPKVGRSFFDQVIENDDDIVERLECACDWDEGEEYDWEDEDEFNSSVAGCVYDMALTISGEHFIESVGINESTGIVAFICGPCNSQRRFQLLMSLGVAAYDIDCVTGTWRFVALFWDRGKQVGIDLRTLGFSGTDGNRHVFDAAAAFGISETQGADER